MNSAEKAILGIVIAIFIALSFGIYQEHETKRECIRTPGCVWQK